MFRSPVVVQGSSGGHSGLTGGEKQSCRFVTSRPPSMATGLRKYRIPSDLRSQVKCRLVSIVVGDYARTLGAMVFLFFSFLGRYCLEICCILDLIQSSRPLTLFGSGMLLRKIRRKHWKCICNAWK